MSKLEMLKHTGVFTLILTFSAATLQSAKRWELCYGGMLLGMRQHSGGLQQQSKGRDMIVSAQEWERESFAEVAAGCNFELSGSYQVFSRKPN